MDNIEKIATEIKNEIIARKNKMNSDKPFIVSIDGRCASGKTTVASRLERELDCNVIHLDQFFLRPEQRTKERLQIPGGNVDYERFLDEVLLPLHKGTFTSYRPFDCSKMELGDAISFPYKDIYILEGSYSCHQKLWDYIDLHVFLSTDYQMQLKRILNRNGLERLEAFKTRWIPMEEEYFKTFNIEDKCELKYRT